jgi:hypothetical protein
MGEWKLYTQTNQLAKNAVFWDVTPCGSCIKYKISLLSKKYSSQI